MTQPDLPFTVPPQPRKRRPSLTDMLEAWFVEHPYAWISVPEMADIVGHSGVRQRRLEVEQRGRYLERRWWRDEQHRHHLEWRYRPDMVGRRAA